MGKTPTGQFGFPVSTHLADVPVDNSWNSSSERFWAQQMKSLLDRTNEIHGTDKEFDELSDIFFNKMIPRYLRPLETEGRSIQPCFIHADLWPGNTKPKVGSDDVCMFDSCAYWGHNEGKTSSNSIPYLDTQILFIADNISGFGHLPQPSISARDPLHRRIP
jgi:protein-ribulosamine 3-kinase